MKNRLWFAPEGICFVGSSWTYWNPKYQITNIKQFPMTKIRNNKQKKDERRTSNAQHRTSNVGVALLRVFNKIETPRAYHNSTLEVRCWTFVFWSGFGPCLEFVIWNLWFIWDLVLGICDFRHKTPRQSRRTLTWLKGPGFSGQNKSRLLFGRLFTQPQL